MVISRNPVIRKYSLNTNFIVAMIEATKTARQKKVKTLRKRLNVKRGEIKKETGIIIQKTTFLSS